MEQKLIFENLYPLVTIFFIGLGAFILSVIAYAPAFRRWASEWVALLILIRTLAVAVLLLGLAGPAIERQTRATEKTSVAVLVDVSRSMSMEDGKEGASRLRVLKNSLLSNRVAYEIVNNKCRVREYAFAAEARPLETSLIELIKKEMQQSSNVLPAQEPRTAIGDVLGELARLEGKSAPHVIVLMSDGASNAGEDPIEQALFLGTFNIPVFCVGYGLSELSGASRDLAAVDIKATKKVPEEGYLNVEARFAASGLPEEDLTFNLEIEGKTVRSKRVKVQRSLELVEVSFRHTPSAPGFQKVTVSAATLADELIDDNNSISTYTEVISGKIPILYIEGRLRWEYTFLKRLLSQTAGFIVDDRLISPAARRGKGVLPEQKEDWRRYKVVIIGDVQAEAFGQKSLESLSEAVSAGLGVIMIGGLYNFSDTDFVGTPMSEVLPVFIAKDARQINEPLRIIPSEARPLPAMLRLSDKEEENLALWKSCPALDGLTTTDGPKRAATVLAEASWVEGEGSPQPVFIIQNFGRGRSAALLVDSTWRWVMEGPPYSSYYKQFWLETLLWLSGSDLPSKGKLQVILDDYRVKKSSEVKTTVIVTDSEGNPVTDVTLHATLIGPDKELHPLELLLKDKSFVVTWKPEKVGDYRLSFSATKGGVQIDEKHAKVVSYEEDEEMKRVPADFYTLRQIAQKSGGDFYDHSELAELFAKLSGEKAETSVTLPVKIELWNSIYACIFFIALLSVEWLIRRRLGMA